MAKDRFDDRLDPATYKSDPVVGVFENHPTDGDALWLSERLWARLIDIAAAYQLHTLPQLRSPQPVRLNQLQCESLLDELDFVAERVNDALTTVTAEAITAYVVARTRRPHWPGTITFDAD